MWFAATPAGAALNDPNFTEGVAFDAVTEGTSFAWATDGTNRLFITQKSGAVRVVEDGVLLATPFATVTPVFTNNECGLLSVAFDPNFVENHYVYFFVTVSGGEQQIVRYRDEDGIGVDKTPIVTGLATAGINHDGGAMAFGPDGKLYWAIGDNGGGVGTGEDLLSTAAKVSRANRDGSAPEDNPFNDGIGPNNDYIWARGFRNPFTMTFQPKGGRLWVNVVGTAYEQVFTPVAGDNAGYTMYENNQPAPFISPVLSYATNNVGLAGVTTATRMAGIATYTTNAAHGLRPGGKVTVSGATDPTFNQIGYVSSIPSPTEFTLQQVGPNASTTGGSMQSNQLGGCITGGVFYDSTAGNAGYRGNYFFGDFMSGKIVRAIVEGPNIRAADLFAQNAEMNGLTDVNLGPDGDLYTLNYYRSPIVRMRFNAFEQRIVASPTNLWTLEAGRGAFHVRLAMPPADEVSVSIVRASGNAPISVTDGATLTFDADNWSTPQPVFVATGRDQNDFDDEITLDVTASGLTTETVTVRVTDEIAATGGGEGGAGGEGGLGEGGEAATGGEAGGGTGTTGGTGGRGGTSGTAGTVEGGAPGAGGHGDHEHGDEAESTDDSGCDCALGRGNNGSAALLLAVGWLFLRRRASRTRALGER